MNYNEINLNTLLLNTPNSISGNYYFSKLSLNNNNNNIQFKLNPCILCKKINNLKNSDNYSFFKFKENDENLNTFLINLEDKIIEILYRNSEDWFENNVSIDDIKDSTYGFIKNNKDEINIKLKLNPDTYDANSIMLNDKLINLDDFNSLDYIIPIVQLKGIKFNPKNFYIVLELKDYISMKNETLENDITDQLLVENNNEENKNVHEDNVNDENVHEDNVNDENVDEDNVNIVESENTNLESENKNNDILENNDVLDNNDINNYENINVSEHVDRNEVESDTNKEVLEENLQDNVEEPLEENVQENLEENVVEPLEENLQENTDNLEENDIEEFDINVENLEKNLNFDESKNILKLNENRLLFYKLYVLFSDQIKTHQVDLILGKLNEMNIEYNNFIDFLNKEDEIYLNEDNFTLA